MKFKILSEKPQKDGGLLLECEFDEEWKEAYKKATGKKRATKKGMEKWVIEKITEGCKEDNLNKLPPEGCSGGHY
jgi:hypothetical protein